MGRIGVTEYQVFQAAEQLAADGLNPSVDTVRVELGNTGSRTTINNYLKAWRERRAHREKAGANLSGHLRQVITEQAELLLTALESESEAKLQAKLQKFDTALQAQTEKIQLQETELSQFHTQFIALQHTIDQQRLFTQQQQSELVDAQEENQSLREALAKEVGRREAMDGAIKERDQLLANLHNELKTARARNEILNEALAHKATELQLNQQQEREHRSAIKEKNDEIKRLAQLLKSAQGKQEKEMDRLSRSISALANAQSTTEKAKQRSPQKAPRHAG